MLDKYKKLSIDFGAGQNIHRIIWLFSFNYTIRFDLSIPKLSLSWNDLIAVHKLLNKRNIGRKCAFFLVRNTFSRYKCVRRIWFLFYLYLQKIPFYLFEMKNYWFMFVFFSMWKSLFIQLFILFGHRIPNFTTLLTALHFLFIWCK